MSLADLHLTVQHAMGWENIHPYRFEATPDIHYGVPGRTVQEGVVRPVSQSSVADLFRSMDRGLVFRYVYDFDDSWVHRIKLMGVGEATQGELYPRLLDARRQCPPEDCGGHWGYRRFLRSMGFDGRHAMAESTGLAEDFFDPESVDEASLRAKVRALAEIVERRLQPSR